MKKTITILSLAILACTQAMAQTRDTVALENFDTYLSKANGEVCVAVTGVTDESKSLDSLTYSLRKYPQVSVDLALVGNPKLTEIKSEAFRLCSSLTGISLPEGIKDIDKFAFAGLSSLKKVILPNSLEYIRTQAFMDCYGIKELSIPSHVHHIHEMAFANCSGLTKIEVRNPNVVITPNEYDSYIQWVHSYDDEWYSTVSPQLGTMYSDHTYIAYSAFWGCDILQSKGDPKVGIINGRRFPYVGPTIKEFVLPDTMKISRLEHISGIDNLESLAINANEEGRLGVFYSDADHDHESPMFKVAVSNCPNLKTITVSNNIKEFGAIVDCMSLETVDLPDTMDTFYGVKNAPKLQRIKIPYGLNDIPCFENCHSLKEVVFTGDITNPLPETSSNNFNNCYSLEKVILPKGIRQLYSYYNPINDEYGTFGNCRSLKEIVIPEGIEEIEEGSFYGCSSLESVTIPSTVKKIAHHAFAGCKSLKTINLPDSLVEIGDFAFEGCESLKTINNIPQSCTIGKGAFWACKSLSKGKNPKTIRLCRRELDYYGTDVVAEFSGYVPENYFAGFTSLRSVEIKGNITDIKAGAFAGCINLKSIKWPKDLIVIGERYSQSIGDYHNVFEDCLALEKLDIPEGVLHVYGIGQAFKEVTWPSTIYSMGYVGERIQRQTIKSDNYLPEIWKTESIINYGYWYSGILPLNYNHQYPHPIDIYVKAHLVPEYEAGMQKAIDLRAVAPEVRDMVRFHAIEE